MDVPHLDALGGGVLEASASGRRGGGFDQWCSIGPSGRWSGRLEGGTCSNAIRRRRAA